jgi:hypothetical protein
MAILRVLKLSTIVIKIVIVVIRKVETKVK